MVSSAAGNGSCKSPVLPQRGQMLTPLVWSCSRHLAQAWCWQPPILRGLTMTSWHTGHSHRCFVSASQGSCRQAQKALKRSSETSSQSCCCCSTAVAPPPMGGNEGLSATSMLTTLDSSAGAGAAPCSASFFRISRKPAPRRTHATVAKAPRNAAARRSRWMCSSIARSGMKPSASAAMATARGPKIRAKSSSLAMAFDGDSAEAAGAGALFVSPTLTPLVTPWATATSAIATMPWRLAPPCNGRHKLQRRNDTLLA
mmetsp:Transcript_31005/g.65974  ORF Transcript_31005/g.65974 Transcript_31005/m.65974 type:complete len:257 (+) Transcript_31005:227-997(+)